jgi:Phage portal protein, SPP1 Gp6-like
VAELLTFVDRVDATESGSPGWWLEQLGKKLHGGLDRLDTLWGYYDGDAALPEATPNVREAYKRFQKRSRTNWAELIVEAPRSRMRPVGFRTGAGGDDNGDKAARAIWDQNDLDVHFADLMTYMLAMSRGYIMVGLDAGEPLITVEDPRQVVTDHDPARPAKVRAGFKLYRDEPMKEDVATLLLPGQVWTAKRPADRVRPVLAGGFRAADWEWTNQSTLPIPVVPMIRFRNLNGRGEFEKHLDVLDRINTMVLQRIVIAVMQAFRQRALIGQLPRTDEDGTQIDYSGLFVADAGALWEVPEGVEMWESAATDLGPLLDGVKHDVMHLAAVTQTPMHMLLPETVQGSAEGASLAREGLVYKVEDRMTRANIGLRSTLSLAFLLAGDTQRAAITEIDTIWAPPERLSMSERASANSQALGVPWRTRMTEIMGFPPEVVDRMEGERMADAFFDALTTQQPGGAGTGPAASGGPTTTSTTSRTATTTRQGAQTK